jgi:hypothetical protein
MHGGRKSGDCIVQPAAFRLFGSRGKYVMNVDYRRPEVSGEKVSTASGVLRYWSICLAVLASFGSFAATGVFSEQRPPAYGTRLVAAYPDFLSHIEGNWLVWKDGTRMPLDDGTPEKPFEQLLASPDIGDMFRWPYPNGRPATAPAFRQDPGRIRYQPLFDRMYGDCAKGGTERHLVDVVWLPRKSGQRLKVSRVNGVARRLEAVSRELDELPRSFDRYLVPAAGTYNCRPIAGTGRPSAHGAGIAIDIALEHAHYWRWSKPDASGGYPFRNSVPPEIVAVFEKHGFIWGGRWYHYDTMHFEYRPELLPPG